MRVDALQKYRNQLLSAFNAEQLQYLKYDSWSGLLTETDRLYATMFHDWDVLQKDCSDLAEAVQTLEWTVAPYVADGEKPNAKAQEVAKTVTDALWKRTPHAPGTYSHSFPQLINALVHALFRGYNVHEIEWVNSDGLVYPAAFHQLPPQFMRWEDRAGQVDRLLFIPDGETETPRPFPKNKYLVALNTSGPDHPLFNAMYYSLIAWYGAYKFGLGWFMEYCQKYGMPKLVFHYESESDRRQLEKDLAEERVLNNILLKGDRAVDIANAPASGSSLPQRELLNLAESQCHKLILGQTLTSDTSQHGGSLAQAKVHAGVQSEVVKKRADFVADVLNSQLIPAIVLLNYGTLDVPMPELRYKIPQEGVTLERVQVVKTALEIKGMKLKKSEVYEFTGFAQPADGDDVFEAASEGDMAGLAGLLGKGKPKDDTDPDDDPNKPRKAPAKESEDVEPVSAAKTDAPTDPAQEWLAPIKQKFLEARKAGASMADMRKMLLTMHPNTKALAKAFANNILAGFAGESEEVDAANPYGCNQYGEGWVRPHNGMQTLKRRKDATPAPDTSKLDELKVDDDDDSPEAMEKRKQRFDLHKQFAEEMEKRLQEWLKGRGDKVKAAAGTEDDKRPFPVQMPDGSMCHTYGCERHKGADELAIKQADKKLDELMRQAKEAFEKGQMTKLQKIMEEHNSWRSYVEKVMALLGLKQKANKTSDLEYIKQFQDRLKQAKIKVDELNALKLKRPKEPKRDDFESYEDYRDAALVYIKEMNEAIEGNIELDKLIMKANAEALALPENERASLQINWRTKKLDETRRWNAGKLEPTKERSDFALSELNKLVSKNVQPDGMKDVKFYVTQKRSCYKNESRRNGNAVYLNASEFKPSVVPHEVMHWLENNNKTIGQKAVEFLLRRAESNSSIVKTGSESWEHAYKDSFAEKGNSEYAGKIYFTGLTGYARRGDFERFSALTREEKISKMYATEILSCGIERVLTDAARFAEEDPEYFAFTIRTLRGE